MSLELFSLPVGKNGVFNSKGDGKTIMISKTQLLNEARNQTVEAKRKNKRRLREALVFRPVKGYKSWRQFIGDCQPIKDDSVAGVRSIKDIIARALEARGVEEPCIAVFRLDGKSYVYHERNRLKIYNGKLLIEKGGNWYREEDEEGNIIGWFLENRDADRTMEGEYLLTEEIPFPNDMDDAWQKICTERYGQICDKYHIVPERR